MHACVVWRYSYLKNINRTNYAVTTSIQSPNNNDKTKANPCLAMEGDEEEAADVASNENERAKWETTHIYMYENISTHSYDFKHHPLKTLTSCRV